VRARLTSANLSRRAKHPFSDILDRELAIPSFLAKIVGGLSETLQRELLRISI
jgi:hypothetical protein